MITTPIDTDTPSVPPIAAWPSAGDNPPSAEAINDPIEPAATCGDWLPQSSYGGQWPAGFTWWEYQCAFVGPTSFGGEPTVPSVWIDYFYWDGVHPIFYGEYYFASYSSLGMYCEYWWNQPTNQWHMLYTPDYSCPFQLPTEPPSTLTPNRAATR